MTAFPRRRFVNARTKRFRGNVTDVADSPKTTRVDALSATDECVSNLDPRRRGTADGDRRLMNGERGAQSALSLQVMTVIR
jgi:hypothetical protein